MPNLTPTKVEIYVFRRRARRVEFLCLKRSDRKRLAGVWQPVTGNLLRSEHALAGAMREVREETGLSPRRWWALESVGIYFYPPTGRVRVMAMFAAEVGAAERVRLSREHSASAFLRAGPAGRRFLWEAQRRGLETVRRDVLRGGPLARELEVTKMLRRTRS